MNLQNQFSLPEVMVQANRMEALGRWVETMAEKNDRRDSLKAPT